MTDQPEANPVDLSSESREIWDTNAANFDERVSSGGGWQTILIAPTVERLLAVQPGETALDLACGNGIFSRRLADLGAQVVAADFSPKFIDLARQRSTEYADRIEYHVADATDEAELLALAGDDQRRFDLACCNMALMDMPAIAPLFRAVAKLLKPDGRFVFSVMHPCFNGQAISRQIELPDYATQPNYVIKISSYLSAGVTKGIAVRAQPREQFYWHRPLHQLFNAAFESGLVMDRLEEPALPAEGATTSGFDWTHFDMPPVLFARLRPDKPHSPTPSP